MGRIIGIVSGKGGVGKSVVCAGLGKGLASLGRNVCVIDLDFGLNNLDLMLNLENKVVYDVKDYLSGKSRLRQTLVQDEKNESLYYLSTAKIKSFNEVDTGLITELVKKLAEAFDYVLIDGPAGVGDNAKLVLEVSSEFIIVTNPSISSIRDANKMLMIISPLLKPVKVVACRLRADHVGLGYSLNENDISQSLNIKLLGVVPELDYINIAGSVEKGYNCNKMVKTVFDTLATNMDRNQAVIVNYLGKYNTILGKIFLKLKSEGI